MKNYNEEYFYLKLVEHSGYPMLALDDDFKKYALRFLRTKPIEYTKKIQLKFREPIPQKPQMADYNPFTTPSPVLSEKLKKVIEDMQVKDIQFVPVLIRDKKDEFIEGFHAIKVCNSISCANMDLSDYASSEPGEVDHFNKLVLDNEKLDNIPLEDRLIFAVEEEITTVLYHISVVEKMLNAAPTGMTVYRLAGYDPSAPFYEAYGEYLKGLTK